MLRKTTMLLSVLVGYILLNVFGGLFKKKSITDLRHETRLSQRRLEKQVKSDTKLRDEAYLQAREGLKNGDERAFRQAGLRYTSLSNRLKMSDGLLKVADRMANVLWTARSLKELEGIAKDMGNVMNYMGYTDASKLEKEMSRLARSMESVAMNAETMIESVQCDTDQSEEMAELRASIMADIETEDVGGLERRIMNEEGSL